MQHPFAELLDMRVVEQHDGHGRMRLEVCPDHLNPHGVVHGAVLYALADTGMGLAKLESRLLAGDTLVALPKGKRRGRQAGCAPRLSGRAESATSRPPAWRR